MGRSTASKPKPFDYSEPAIALADLLAGLGRGTTAAATGIAGDLEDLYRQFGKGAVANAVRLLVPTREGKATTFPTIEEMKAMLPPVVPAGAGRSAQMADVGQFFGENNPLAPTAIAAVKPVAKAAAKGALDLARSEPARKAVDRVVRATGAGPMKIMAYQGSPHKFAPTEKNPLGEFDSTKIGSGEGAQAYGHGHYLAESPKTGQRYKESTSANMYQTPSGVIRSSDLVDELLKNSGEVPKQLQSAYNAKANEVVRDLIMGKSSQEIANEIKNSKYGGMYQGLINAVENVAPKKAEGHLYTVDLPDEKIAQMLNWDRLLSEQAGHIQDFARAHDPNFSSKEPHFVTPQGEAIHWSGLLDNPEDLQNPRLKAIGQKVYRGGDWVDYGDYMMNKTTGADLYRKLSSPSEWHNQVSAGTGKAGLEDVDASALLRAHGIPGIRYLDEMSRDAGQGTSNFVVFPGEEDALTILRREKEGGAIHMADGGSADFFIDPSSYAQAKSKEMYPKKKSEWTERDAARHMLASGMMAQKFGPTTAKMAGLAHEHLNAPIKSLGYVLGLNKMPADYEQDLHNNALGIELAKRAVTQEELERFIKEMTSKSSKTKTEGVPFIGEPKNAARLSDY